MTVWNASTPQVSESCERAPRLRGEREHRDPAAQPGEATGRVAGLGERDDVLGVDPLRDLLGSLGDDAGAGVRVPVDPAEPAERVVDERVVLGRGDDPRHRLDGVDRVLAHAGLTREHHRVGAVEHRVGDVARLGARRRGVGDHRLEHLGRDDHRLGVAPRRDDDLLLQEGHLLQRALHAEVAARDHEAVERLDELVEVVDRLRLLDLRDDGEEDRPPRA